ncbi:tRNA isopentenyltransferase, putative [Pediculus humanus corporis]|uniref:tRNA isopentenyltransferase, putative n=1 Tax=Pediculus humanus subsp. corporis TaxID=121224 RepID=E0W103_PEDHC|nr:tRNA isopentenyltransferase, putative [Pediculus humanus corporis]EEB19308.1 tRNA isopentenyltransferase, putative [Pediculus humanus corporis]
MKKATTDVTHTHKRFVASNDYTRGILQTIGFKEFKDYLLLDEDGRKSENGKKLFENGVELLKIATKQYATRQRRWIRNRFLKNARRQVPPIYGLDATDLSKWNENVLEKASDIVECHLAGRKSAIKPLPMENEKISIDKSYHCQVCDRIFVGKLQWESHVETFNSKESEMNLGVCVSGKSCGK